MPTGRLLTPTELWAALTIVSMIAGGGAWVGATTTHSADSDRRMGVMETKIDRIDSTVTSLAIALGVQPHDHAHAGPASTASAHSITPKEMP